MLAVEKHNRYLFHILLVAKDAGRDVYLRKVLQEKLSTVPLSLAHKTGNMRSCAKAALLHILEKGFVEVTMPVTTMSTCTIIDGQALVKTMDRIPDCRTFGNFADKFAERVFAHFKGESSRVDVMFDRYHYNYIKAGTRSKRKGNIRSIKRIINNREVAMVSNWNQFVVSSDNKQSLANFLSHQLMIKSTDMS